MTATAFYIGPFLSLVIWRMTFWLYGSQAESPLSKMWPKPCITCCQILRSSTSGVLPFISKRYLGSRSGQALGYGFLHGTGALGCNWRLQPPGHSLSACCPQCSVFEYGRPSRPVQSDIDRAVAEVLHSGQFIGGPNRLRKRRCQNWWDCPMPLGLAGTSALKLALQALGVGPGDEVIVHLR